MKKSPRPCPTCQGSGVVYEVPPEELRRIREDVGASQSAVARSIGVSGPYLCDVEKGRRATTNKVIQAYERLEETPWTKKGKNDD